MTLSLTLPFATPTLNRLLRMHWAERRRLGKQCELWVSVAARQAATPRAQGRRWVEITRHGPRLLDDDNLRGGCKPVLDALRYAGLIADDSPDLVSVGYRQVIDRVEPRTTVRVSDEGE